MTVLNWIEQWYQSNCSNSSWENIYGITICTIDNPGWMVKIELMETPFEKKTFDNIFIEHNNYNGEHWDVGWYNLSKTCLDLLNR